MTLESALDKDELKGVFKKVTNRLEKGVVKTFSLDFEKYIEDAFERPSNFLSEDAIDRLNDSPLDFEHHSTRLKGKDGLYKIENAKYNSKTFLRKDDDGYKMYFEGSLDGINVDLEEIKAIILEEVVKEDSTILFKGRDGLTIVTDSITEINDELGERKARHKRHKRLKKYKDRIDNLIDKENADDFD